MNPGKNEQSGATNQVARKQATAKKLIGRYFRQLTEGCGNGSCVNEFCASSNGRSTQLLSKDEAAAEALRLFLCHAKLCDDASPSKDKLETSMGQFLNNEIKMDDLPAKPLTLNLSDTNVGDPALYLTEELLNELIEKCKAEGSYLALSSTIFQVFSNIGSLKMSFHRSHGNGKKITELRLTEDASKETLTKEDIRAMEIDQDKDEDSKELEDASSSNETDAVGVSKPSTLLGPDEVTLDMDSVRRAFATLFSLPSFTFQNAMINAIIMSCQHLEIELRYNQTLQSDSNLVNIFLIVMEIPMLEFPEYLESALPAFCKTLAMLPLHTRAKLARVWSKSTAQKLKEKVVALHQLIALRVITAQFGREFSINDEETVVVATKVMKILYCAAILGGVMDPRDAVEEDWIRNHDDGNFLNIGLAESKEPKQVKQDELCAELNVVPLHCRKPLINWDEFYNEPLSDQLEMHRDFSCYKNDPTRFSFMSHAFILTPAVKALGLYYDNRITMFSERRLSVFQSFVHGEPPNPYLRLNVRRDHLIDDTLVGLEVVAMENPSNLKKQLVVEFEGEQGIDEGGISKEFFQLIVEELFNPDYAMFTINADTHTYWFNPTSFESDAQFTLVGIVLGLAIYNNIILDVHFSMVVYKKLLGKKGTYYDLADWNPSLARGLEQLLSYDGDDIEDAFMLTFRISYQDIFGAVLNYDLKPNGDQIVVNQSNKQEMVDLYADFLLNKSIERQFRAFRQGFQMVTDDSPLKSLFRPEEIELLVCGSQNFDFNALEEATEYDGGYNNNSTIIKSFWELVHEFTLDQKRKLLQFATGSDRAPVGGLAKLKLVIARSGPDSERLPTAHTCFNVLLLPEYETKEKLKERLLKAINYSKGFGML